MRGSQDENGVMGKQQGPCMTRSTMVDQRHPCIWCQVGPEGPQENGRVHAWWSAGPERPQETTEIPVQWSARPEIPKCQQVPCTEVGMAGVVKPL